MGLKKMALFTTTALALCGCNAFGQTVNCSAPPNPTKNFLENFLNSCYAFVFPAGLSTTGAQTADLTESYAGFFYYVNSGYEILLIGDFPQSRYLNIAFDDSHLFTQQSFHDSQLIPLSSSYVNPFVPGQTYVPNQLYSVALQFGGTQPANIQAGCAYAAGQNFYANVVDGTQRHPPTVMVDGYPAKVSWTGSPLVYPGFPPHDDAGPNAGGMVTVRQYLNETPTGGVGGLATPVAIVRDLSTGCAVPLTNAVANDPSNILPSQVVTRNNTIATNWLSQQQIWAHKAFRAMKPTLCYDLSPQAAQWYAPDVYVPNPNPDSGYLHAVFNPTALNWVITNPGFMRLRFQLPTTANIPCAGCSLTGTEQLRYFDVSFEDNQNNTLATIGSPNLVTDPNGNVTLIVGFGSAPPSWVTAANYYTYLDLSQVTGYTNLENVSIRTILPASTFACSASVVYPKFSEGNSLGGSMGQYVPFIDVLEGQSIPPVATPAPLAQSCGLVPPEKPTVCMNGVYP
jgi:hypothetical protein